MIQPNIWKGKAYIGSFNNRFFWAFRPLASVDFVISTCGQNTILPKDLPAMNKGFIAPTDGIVMNKGQVDHIKLVFDATRIMSIPMIFNLAIGIAVINFLAKKGQLACNFILFAIPKIDDAMIFLNWIMLYIVANGRSSVEALPFAGINLQCPLESNLRP